jgi:alkanesulfonate monooxygenase SsuD/methylene tetrahydromethanopterin reductase-like flavin-dependent oxidoreductase (luciferase family)
VDDVMAEKFALWRRPWQEQGHAGPMPRTFLMRAVHVAETDAIYDFGIDSGLALVGSPETVICQLKE